MSQEMEIAQSSPQRLIPIRRIFILFLFLLILVPIVTLSLSTWYVFDQEVEMVEKELQESNHQIAQLAERSLISLLDEMAVYLSSNQPDPKGEHQVPIRHWEEISPEGTVLFSTFDSPKEDGPRSRALSWRKVTGLSDVEFEISDEVAIRDSTELMLPIRVGLNSGYRVAFIDAHFLHRWLTSQFESFIERHVYAIDSKGYPIFYSNMDLAKNAGSLRSNPPVMRFLEGKTGAIRYQSTISGKERMGFVLPIQESGWGLIVSVDIGTKMLDLRRRFAWIVAAFAVGGLFAVVVFFYFSRLLVDPITFIAREVRKHRPAVDSLRLPSQAKHIREFSVLVSEFNAYMERLQIAEEQAIQAEKLATLGELTAGLAHEIGTPLNVMQGNAQYLMKKMAPEDPDRLILEKIVMQTGRITELIRSLLNLARFDRTAITDYRIEQVITEAVETVSELYPGVEIQVKLANSLPSLRGNPRRMEHALLNVMQNGSQAMDGAGALIVSAEPDRIRGRGAIRIVIEDTGSGIADEDLPRIFQPFFSTKGSGQGSGLGLALVERVVKEHQGSVAVTSTVGQGTCFAIHLPVLDQKGEADEFDG